MIDSLIDSHSMKDKLSRDNKSIPSTVFWYIVERASQTFPWMKVHSYGVTKQ
jgi:hypothetical protein